MNNRLEISFNDFMRNYSLSSNRLLDDFQQKFITFSNNYLNFQQTHRKESEQKFIVKFKNFQKSHKLFSQLSDEINFYKAEEFNIFSIWNTGHLEVVTHTPFLAALIDPNGKHGQKRIFFNKFMRKFSNLSDEEILSDGWKIICEQERVDLKIVNFKLMKAIFIENKVYSSAHSGQLSRYYKIFKDTFNSDGSFIYLTVDGEYPNDEGFDDTVFDRNNMNIKCISYKVDIYNWLHEIVNKIKAPKVRETIDQYLELLKKDNWR